jgi:hypothetical protein
VVRGALVERPASAFSVRLWLVAVTLDMFLITWLSARFASDRAAAWVMVPVTAMAGANGLEHLYWLVHFEAYAPGVVFGGVVGVPVAAYVARRALVERLVPPWYVMICAGYAVATVVLVIRTDNTLPPVIRAVTAFSDWVAGIVGPWLGVDR